MRRSLTPEVRVVYATMRESLLHLRLIMAVHVRLNALKGATPIPLENTELGQKLEAAFWHPEQAAEQFPPNLLVGYREAVALLDEIGREGYGQELQSQIWQAIMRPFTLERSPMRANHPLWKTMGIDPNREATPEEAGVLMTSLVTSHWNAKFA
ncbi:MAG TPA: hypothetical protein VI855_09100 [Dehalococcoidia bacterium]|nr:hypothetical protein [Dehalococcoidia bacterium]